MLPAIAAGVVLLSVGMLAAGAVWQEQRGSSGSPDLSSLDAIASAHWHSLLGCSALRRLEAEMSTWTEESDIPGEEFFLARAQEVYESDQHTILSAQPALRDASLELIAAAAPLDTFGFTLSRLRMEEECKQRGYWK